MKKIEKEIRSSMAEMKIITFRFAYGDGFFDYSWVRLEPRDEHIYVVIDGRKEENRLSILETGNVINFLKKDEEINEIFLSGKRVRIAKDSNNLLLEVK